MNNFTFSLLLVFLVSFFVGCNKDSDIIVSNPSQPVENDMTQNVSITMSIVQNLVEKGTSNGISDIIYDTTVSSTSLTWSTGWINDAYSSLTDPVALYGTNWATQDFDIMYNVTWSGIQSTQLDAILENQGSFQIHDPIIVDLNTSSGNVSNTIYSVPNFVAGNSYDAKLSVDLSVGGDD